MKENQPKHRQFAKERRKLERKQGDRAGLPTALIVCEGQKTEPFYLRALVRHLDVNPANVRIDDGATDSDAVSVVRRAQRRFAENPNYDSAFVVIDAEQKNLDQALALARKPLRRPTKTSPGLIIEPILSNPCFEFWILLHFVLTDRPYGGFADLLPDLRAYLPDYDKADRQIFAKVKSGLDRAVDHAAKVKQALAASGADCPDTQMPALLEALSKMKRS